MKLRQGFVSNSSSSSFLVLKDYISVKQMEKIENHIELGKKMGMEYAEEHDRWSIEDQVDRIKLSTTMDNFDMGEFLDRIGVPEEAVEWRDF